MTKSRRHLTDCWTATLRVSIPITSTAASLTAAQAAVAGLALPDGATVEIMAQRFGRMAVVQTSVAVPSTTGHEPVAQERERGDSIAEVSGSNPDRLVTPPDTGTLTFPPIPPAFDRRVPRVG